LFNTGSGYKYLEAWQAALPEWPDATPAWRWRRTTAWCSRRLRRGRRSQQVMAW